MQKDKQSNRKWVEELIDISTKKTYRWRTDTRNDVQYR